MLLDETGAVKIADFGVARVMDHTGIMTAETGTYRWVGWGGEGSVGVHRQAIDAQGAVGSRLAWFLPMPTPCDRLCRLALHRWMAPEVIEHNPYKEKADVFRCDGFLML